MDTVLGAKATEEIMSLKPLPMHRNRQRLDFITQI